MTSSNEMQRLLALDNLQLLDQPAEQEVSDIVKLAANILGGSMAMVSLIDEERQCFFARHGTDLTETPREQSFCQHCVAMREPLIVKDAAADKRFEDNPLVTGEPYIRSYIGVPVRAPSGIELGALCVISREPDAFGKSHVEVLRPLANAVEGFIALRERNLKLAESHDILAKEARDKIKQHEAVFRQSERLAGAGAWQINLEDSQLSWSENIYAIHGHPIDEPITVEQAMRYYGEEDREMVEATVSGAIERGKSLEFEANIERRDGTIKRIRAVGERVSFEGQADQILGVIFDITEQHASIQRLRYAANHDSLTGLINRQAFDNELSRRILDFNPTQGDAHLIMVDLDRFKDVNDFFGHLVGDAVLEEVANRLARSVDQDTLIARWGGDEFAVLTNPGCTDEDANLLAGRLIEVCSAQIKIGGHNVSVGASCGISPFRKGVSARELLRRSDLALYHGKNREPGRAHFYRGEFELESQARKKAITSLSAALDEDRVFAGYQPIIELRTGKAVGMEALLRLNNANGDILTASNVLPALLDPGLSRLIFDRMLDSICSDYRRLVSALPDLEFISINATEADLLCHDFVENLLGKLAKANVDPHSISLEFTETLLMVNDTKHVQQVLGRLRSQGISIALDDFGTGFSSLTHLRDFPIDKIKIDRSFTNGITRDQNSLMIVQALASMGHSMSLEIVAEGVENERERGMLKQLGCRLGQGYFFSHAESVERIELGAARLCQRVSEKVV